MASKDGYSGDPFPKIVAGGVLLVALVLIGIGAWALFGGDGGASEPERVAARPPAAAGESPSAESPDAPTVAPPTAETPEEAPEPEAADPSPGDADTVDVPAPRDVEPWVPSGALRERVALDADSAVAARPQTEGGAPDGEPADTDPAEAEPSERVAADEPAPPEPAMAEFPADAAAANAEGLERFRRGQYAAAARLFRLAATMDPDNAEYQNNYGWALFKAGRVATAARELEQALEMDPQREIAYANLAEVRLAQGDTAAAILLYEGFLALNTDPEREARARETLRELRAGG